MFTSTKYINLARISIRLLSLAAFFCLFVWQFQSGDAIAGSQYDIDRDLERLPALCKFKTHPYYRTNFVGREKWSPEVRMANEWGYRQYGDEWWSMHHYCWGLFDSLRAAEAFGTVGAGSALRSAIGNYTFVIKNAKPPHTKAYIKLEAQLYYRIGRAYEGLGEHEEAGVAYALAIQRDPTYEQAYAAFSDLFHGLGQDDEARKILRDGLEQVPNSSILGRRMAELSPKANVE